MATLPELLKTLVDNNGSDLHITTNTPPQIRVHGHLQAARSAVARAGRDQGARLQRADRRAEEALRGNARARLLVRHPRHRPLPLQRVQPARRRGGRLPRDSRGHQERSTSSGLPQVIANLADRPRGLVLVTGPTGSGKSTTLAAMIDKINTERHEHILTIEDPIEFVHQHKSCLVNQREVHADTHGFTAALRAALREDPDVVLIGELRDLETIESALRIAETGHLTFATLHTNSAAQTINRIIDVFPAHQQGQIRTQLSLVLEGIVCQALVPKADGKGRVVALEIMVPNPAIRNLIRDDKVHQIYSSMQTGQEKLGMQTMNQCLATLYQKRLITLEAAMEKSSLKDELEQMIARGAGVVAGAGLQPARRGLPAGASGTQVGARSREVGSRALKPAPDQRATSEGTICRHLLYADGRGAGRRSTGERVADTMDAAVAALRREQILITKIDPVEGREGRGRRPKAAKKGGVKVAVEEPRDLHAPVLGHDRRRPAAGAVPGHPRQAGAAQGLLGGHPQGPRGRRVGRRARRRDEEAPARPSTRSTRT